MESAMAPSDPSEIGRLAPSELADAEALVTEAGWNQVAADWRIFLDLGSVLAVRDGSRVIATAATLPYGGCAWISMVLVAASHRRRGIATRLLDRCITDISAAGLVAALDATPAGRTVYQPLGFAECWGFRRFASARRVVDTMPPSENVSIREIDDSVWSALCAYDAKVFGMDRSHLLGRMRGRLPASNLFATQDERITGLLLGREGRTAAHLGPLSAENDETARALLRHALGRLDGNVYIDFADRKSVVHAWLEAAGFAPQRPFTRMLLGKGQSFDDLDRTYAVIGPEFG
jgi:GNAT superfamily N-acetyltransferase